MARFRLEIEVDNDNTWMRTPFSVGMVVKTVGDKIMNDNSFQELFRNSHPIKDVYGNVVGHYEMIP